MTVGEIARCLYKRGWADTSEFKAALAAYDRLPIASQEKVENLKEFYSQVSSRRNYRR